MCGKRYLESEIVKGLRQWNVARPFLSPKESMIPTHIATELTGNRLERREPDLPSRRRRSDADSVDAVPEPPGTVGDTAIDRAVDPEVAR